MCLSFLLHEGIHSSQWLSDHIAHPSSELPLKVPVFSSLNDFAISFAFLPALAPLFAFVLAARVAPFAILPALLPWPAVADNGGVPFWVMAARKLRLTPKNPTLDQMEGLIGHPL